MSRAVKNVCSPVVLFLKSLVVTTEDDPLTDYERYVDTLEQQLNNVSVSLSGFRARESAARSELEAELVKVDKVTGRIMECSQEDGMELEQLELLKKQYQQTSLDIGRKLERIERARLKTEREYQKLLSAIHKLMEEGDELKARYYTAEAKHTLYGDISGVTSRDGSSRLDRLLVRTKRMEARAQSFVELSPLDARFDAEINST